MKSKPNNSTKQKKEKKKERRRDLTSNRFAPKRDGWKRKSFQRRKKWVVFAVSDHKRHI